MNKMQLYGLSLSSPLSLPIVQRDKVIMTVMTIFEVFWMQEWYWLLLALVEVRSAMNRINLFLEDIWLSYLAIEAWSVKQLYLVAPVKTA
jgi:hypothetical protein